ncbi:MAG: GxxExxY protein [Oleiphilaceae bacterium]|jgi:GxxExxY protein
MMETDFLTQKVIGCAIEVHKNLGPGLLELSYESCLMYELNKAGLIAKRQAIQSINYKDMQIDAGYRLDILLPEQLIIELKSVERLASIHTAQILTYLKLSKINTGLLINFNVEKLINGLKRISI